MSAYTPGPWQVDPNNPGDVNGPDGKDVAVALFSGMTRIEITGNEPTLSDITREEARANSRLISAAPELLEACQTFAEWLRREEEGLPAGIERGTPEGERQWRIWWEENLRICALAQQQAIAAIAKATGEQP